MIRMIVKPLNYIKIVWNTKDANGKEYDQKKRVDIYLPLNFSILFSLCMLILYLVGDYSIFFKSEAFYYLTSFLQTLPGFYIAALAAIVSFSNEKLDVINTDDCPIDKDGYGMTFRRFLSNIFAYLAWVSIFLIIFCITLKYVFEQEQVEMNLYFFSVIYLSLLVPFSFFFTQLVSITAMSLSYLGDRIHRP